MQARDDQQQYPQHGDDESEDLEGLLSECDALLRRTQSQLQSASYLVSRVGLTIESPIIATTTHNMNTNKTGSGQQQQQQNQASAASVTST
eukprot:CAMPEP_0113468142 /NCGR_PEP_ID=MMETSP0014_2-20120614/15196_1 /TAXON_ID=2857 /ORGANISM="Nitzschia sp." /LENGTH=90 /DNA_ID=CAMNT_0000360509 /DNA_START=71 /DNA_END=340 /DNA_ORIENTATION=- /assembly_acc=CAM_ASM_000159